jgi:predicted DNA-binding protein
MATLNPRINITVPKEVSITLAKAAKQNNKSVSKVAAELIEWAIEEREDMHFSQTAEEILASNPVFITVSEDDDIWK